MPDEFGRLVGDETPYDPPTLRERLIQMLASLLGVDLLDAHLKRGMDRREQRMQAKQVDLLTSKHRTVVEKSYADEEDFDVTAHMMWTAMRGDEVISPPTILRVRRDDDGNLKGSTNPKPTEQEKLARKRELLHEVDQIGTSLDPVLGDSIN